MKLINGENRCLRLSEMDTLIKRNSKEYGEGISQQFEDLIFLTIPKLYIDYKEIMKDKPAGEAMGWMHMLRLFKQFYSSIKATSGKLAVDNKTKYIKRLGDTILYLENKTDISPDMRDKYLANVKARRAQLETEKRRTRPGKISTKKLSEQIKKGAKSAVNHIATVPRKDHKELIGSYPEDIKTINDFCQSRSPLPHSSWDRAILARIIGMGGCDHVTKYYDCLLVLFSGKKRNTKSATEPLKEWLNKSHNTISSWFDHLTRTSRKDGCTPGLEQKVIDYISSDKGISEDVVKLGLKRVGDNNEYYEILLRKFKEDLKKIKAIAVDIKKKSEDTTEESATEESATEESATEEGSVSPAPED